ncbi:MAG: sulfite exporter TauE/SafE family protein [Melioribacteraceae bacterium]|jgi:sulfite exporter TauE/SafE|nr:sulfite exporter TauE/SafE family protein [Melioribacteraceae bacterium]
MEIWTGFIIGFLGSFHCVGMCGPIALALPFGKQSNFQLIVGRLLYNIGRSITYAIFGAIFGLFGKGIAVVGLQKWASIILGVSILLYYVTPDKFKGKLSITKPYQITSNFVKKGFSKLTKNGSPSSLFVFGLVNGLLPCGFVYVALAGALTTGGTVSGAMYMFLFGLGTAPIMFATSLVGKFLSVTLRQRMNKLIPVFAIILAIIFILRGLSLGIPFISPPEKMLEPHSKMMMK